MDRFTTSLSTLSIRTRSASADVPLLGKIRWAIQDKAKFETLIHDLSDLISTLNEFVPATENTTESMLRQDLQALSFNQLRLVSQASHGQEPDIKSAVDDLIKEATQKVLNCFSFRCIDDRRISIDGAHKKTLRWPFKRQDGNTKDKWDNLPSWLENEAGIYWISGKAGSGKSTLMKYLYEHKKPKTSYTIGQALIR